MTKDTSHNLKAYDSSGSILFSRRVRSESEARNEVINNPAIPLVKKVIFRKKEFEIVKVYAMVQIQKQYNNQES